MSFLTNHTKSQFLTNAYAGSECIIHKGTEKMEPCAWRVASKTAGKKAVTVLYTLTRRKNWGERGWFCQLHSQLLASSCSWEGGEQHKG